MTTDRPSVNSQVNELYEDYPYPNHRVISLVVAKLLKRTVERLAQQLGTQKLRHLDAGCGTGEQTLGVARAYPDLDVTGIDYSRASLEVARELGIKHGRGVQFQRRNLMESLADLGRFDVMTSIGVLHSLPTPATGLRHLRAVARSHTVLLGMVYGTFGKWRLFQARDALRLLCGEGVDRAEQLRVLEGGKFGTNTGPAHYAEMLLRRVRFGPSIQPLEAVRRVLAGRNAAYQADSYTHVQEESYTWQELSELLADSGWHLTGWPARSGMPDRPEQVLRGRALELARGKDLLGRAAIYERLVKPENLFFLAIPRSRSGS